MDRQHDNILRFPRPLEIHSAWVDEMTDEPGKVALFIRDVKPLVLFLIRAALIIGYLMLVVCI